MTQIEMKKKLKELNDELITMIANVQLAAELAEDDDLASYLDAAQKLIEEAHILDLPEGAESWYHFGNLLVCLDMFHDAAEAYEHAIELQKKQLTGGSEKSSPWRITLADYHYHLVCVLVKLGRPIKATTLFSEMFELYEDAGVHNPQAWYIAGDVVWSLGLEDIARSFYRKVLSYHKNGAELDSEDLKLATERAKKA